MILNDILLELRAIRFGYELHLHRMGVDVDLLKLAKTSTVESSISVKPRQPKDAKSVLHRDYEKEATIEFLRDGADDTESMIAFIGAEYGEDAAMRAREFYEQEILSKGRAR